MNTGKKHKSQIYTGNCFPNMAMPFLESPACASPLQNVDAGVGQILTEEVGCRGATDPGAKNSYSRRLWCFFGAISCCATTIHRKKKQDDKTLEPFNTKVMILSTLFLNLATIVSKLSI